MQWCDNSLLCHKVFSFCSVFINETLGFCKKWSTNDGHKKSMFWLKKGTTTLIMTLLFMTVHCSSYRVGAHHQCNSADGKCRKLNKQTKNENLPQCRLTSDHSSANAKYWDWRSLTPSIFVDWSLNSCSATSCLEHLRSCLSLSFKT